MLNKNLSANTFLKYVIILCVIFVMLNLPLIILGIPYPMIPGLSGILSSFFADPNAQNMIKFGYFVTGYSIFLILAGLVILYLLIKLLQNRFRNTDVAEWIRILMMLDIIVFVLGYFKVVSSFVFLMGIILFIYLIGYIGSEKRDL